MGSINAQGVYVYDDTEDWAPQKDYQNLQADAVTAALADVRAEIAAIESLVDSDWTLLTTFGPSVSVPVGAGYQPRVRKIGNRVDLVGAVSVASGWSASNLLTIPVGFRLVGTYPQQFIGATVTSGGKAIQLYLNNTDHRLQIPVGYATGSVANGEAIPLTGCWYTD